MSCCRVACWRTASPPNSPTVLVAAELVVAVRALRFAGRTPRGAGLQELFAAAILVLPTGAEDRAFGGDVDAAMEGLGFRSCESS